MKLKEKVHEADRYSPVHKFGQKAAFNLNEHCYDDDKNGVYFFFASDEEAFNYNGSAFSTGQMVMTAGLGALGGIVIGTFFTNMVGRRKRKKKPMTA